MVIGRISSCREVYTTRLLPERDPEVTLEGLVAFLAGKEELDLGPAVHSIDVDPDPVGSVLLWPPASDPYQ